MIEKKRSQTDAPMVDISVTKTDLHITLSYSHDDSSNIDNL